MRRVSWFLLCLLVVKLALQLELYQRGFLSVSADEFARGLHALSWAAGPHLDSPEEFFWVWMPVEKYLNGALLWLWPAGLLVPRLTVFAASCLLLVGQFFLIRRLMDDPWSAGVACGFLIFQPWFAWLSGTPMLEMYSFAPLVWGCVLQLGWLERPTYRSAAAAGLCCMVASGFHVQSWVHLGLVSLATLAALFRAPPAARRRLLGPWALNQAIAWLFIGLYCVAERLWLGEWLAFFREHTDYSRWFYEGYAASLPDKFLYYPRLAFSNLDWPTILLAGFGLFFWNRDGRKPAQALPLLLGLACLLIYSGLNLLSVPPTAAPGRYSLFFTLTLAPYVGLGFSRLLDLARLPAALAVWLLALVVWGGWTRTMDFPEGLPAGSIAAGRALSGRLDSSPGAAVIELRYWESLGVELAAGHQPRLLLDRPLDKRRRDLPSLFLQDPGLVEAWLAERGVLWIALKEPGLKAKAAGWSFAQPLEEVGGWTIYGVRLPAARN